MFEELLTDYINKNRLECIKDFFNETSVSISSVSLYLYLQYPGTSQERNEFARWCLALPVLAIGRRSEFSALWSTPSCCISARRGH